VWRTGVLLAEHLVEQDALVVVEQVCPPGLVEVQQPGQLERVVADAVLASRIGQLPGDHAGLLPVLEVAGPADDVGVMPGDDPPEILGDVTVAVVARLLVHPHARDDLRHGGVGVQSGELILPGCEMNVIAPAAAATGTARISGPFITSCPIPPLIALLPSSRRP